MTPNKPKQICRCCRLWEKKESRGCKYLVLVLVAVLVDFRFIRAAVAADSAETPRRPSPQTPPPAPPGGAQGVPRPAKRHSPSSVSRCSMGQEKLKKLKSGYKNIKDHSGWSK
ncbi:hypothetical protein ATANTOWER_020959 [Ataeniobius toweri]|uniref:Uncharacterized protein n=1 Tax=Ataeniobius toweri TaxID=208326 RepID=A0ABU7AQA6_9TELE|nr:hypothetical protein [Ataeniobius toweri]